MRVYETAELAMKFERAMDCETVQFQILSEDWRKACSRNLWLVGIKKFVEALALIDRMCARVVWCRLNTCVLHRKYS